MPAAWVRPEHEEYWQRAKKQAEKQGQTGNWAYVVSIFKQMTKNKSMDPLSDGEVLAEFEDLEKSGLVQPGQEHIWESAKRLASMHGKPNDYEYVKEQFKRMTGWKSLDKSLFIPHSERFYRVPGQPPTRERIAALTLQKEAEKRPQGVTMARLMDGGRPMLSPQAIINGLGFDVVKSRNWGQFLEETVSSASNELVLRKQVMDKAINEGMDSTLRRVILQRSLKHWRGLQKGVVQVVTPEELLEKGGDYNSQGMMSEPHMVRVLQPSHSLCPVCNGPSVRQCRCPSRLMPHSVGQLQKGHGQECAREHRWSGDTVIDARTGEELVKAFTPGGNYHKRVPRKSGKGYNYYYDEDSYKRSKGRHVSGEEAGNEYIGTQIQKAVEEAGDGGCDIGTFEALVKKYGAKRVAGVMKEGGKYSFKKGKLFARKDEENVKKVKLELAQKPVKPPKAMKEEPKKVVREPVQKVEPKKVVREPVKEKSA